MKETPQQYTERILGNVVSQQTYREKMFKVLGDQNPFDVLGQTGSALTDIVDTHTAAVLRSRPFFGKWTPNASSCPP